MYSFVFCRVFIVLVDFRFHCVTTVTPFIRRKSTKTMNTRQNTKEYIKGKYFLFIVLKKVPIYRRLAFADLSILILIQRLFQRSPVTR